MLGQQLVVFENWSPTDAGGAMTDADGDNIWEITIDYPTSGDTVYYKFVNGDWGADESATTLFVVEVWIWIR